MQDRDYPVTTEGSLGNIKEKGVYAAYVKVSISEQMNFHRSCGHNRIPTAPKKCVAGKSIVILHLFLFQDYTCNVNGIAGSRISKSLATIRWYTHPVKGKPLLLKGEKKILALKVVF